MRGLSSHIDNLNSNMEEIDRIVEIHRELGGRARGRRHAVEVLNKSALLLLVACWEAFVEDLAENAFNFLLRNAAGPDAFPAKVLALAATPLRDDADQRKVWNLAGTGWKAVLEAHKAKVFDKSIGKLNTPKYKQVDALFKDLIGYKNLSSRWTWKGMSIGNARKRLEDIIALRGEIAHRVGASHPVRKEKVIASRHFVYRLSVISSNKVRAFLENRTGRIPWPGYLYRRTR